MPKTYEVFHVLVGSPSDCAEAREAIPSVLRKLNRPQLFNGSRLLEPILWETHSRPQLGDRPQAIINEQIVDRCDVLIATFKTRLGSPTGEFASGTVEEINRFLDAGKPVFLYFSQESVPPSSIDRQQYDALVDFKKEMLKKGVVSDYSSIDNLKDMLSDHLASHMAGLPASSLLATVQEPQQGKEAQGNGNQSVDSYRDSFDDFLRSSRLRWEIERDSKPMSLDTGKYMLTSLQDGLIEFSSAIKKGLRPVVEKLNEVAKQVAVLSRHQLYMDGGMSYREFWRTGDQIFETLAGIPDLIDQSREKQSDAE